MLSYRLHGEKGSLYEEAFDNGDEDKTVRHILDDIDNGFSAWDSGNKIMTGICDVVHAIEKLIFYIPMKYSITMCSG